MFKQISIIFTMALCLSSILVSCDSQNSRPSVDERAKHIWVALSGDDAHDGSLETPFKTISRAQQEAREIKSDFQGNIVVNIREGEYRLESPLTFTAQDSGQNDYKIIYRAAEGEKVSIYGSKKIDGWTLCDTSKNIFCADASGLKSRQLYIDDTRALRARTQDYPGGFLPHFDYNETDPEASDPAGILFIPVQNMDGTLDENWPDPNNWENIGKYSRPCYGSWPTQAVSLGWPL